MTTGLRMGLPHNALCMVCHRFPDPEIIDRISLATKADEEEW
jgi:hypothetical protein